MPAVPATAKADSPADNANIPPPIAATPTPNSVIAAANPNIAGIAGVNSVAATPITVNAPANPIKAIPICAKDIDPIVFNAPANIVIETARTLKAKESTIELVFDSRTKAPIISPKETVNAVKLFAISSHDMLLNAFNACDNSSIAPATSIKASDCMNMFLGSAMRANVTIARAEPKDINPLLISPHDILPIFIIAAANRFIATPRIVKLAAVAITFLALPATFINIAIEVNITASPESPLTKSPRLILLNFFTASAKTVIAAAKSRIPTLFIAPIPLRSATFINNTNSAIKTPTPTNPLAKSARSRPPNCFTAWVRIRIAVPNITKPTDTAIKLLELVSSNFVAPTNIPVKPVIAARPFATPFQSRLDNFSIADASMRTATDKPIIPVVSALIAKKPLTPAIALNTAIAPKSSTNIAVIAAKEVVSFSESIIDIVRRAAANIPIDIAIFNNTFAFKLD